MTSYNNLVMLLNEGDIDEITRFLSYNKKYINGDPEKNETLPPLYISLKKGRIDIANRLLDIGQIQINVLEKQTILFMERMINFQ